MQPAPCIHKCAPTSCSSPEEPPCKHPETFCPNGLRITQGQEGHVCRVCGEKLETDVPPCNCCCHQEVCGGNSNCLEMTCSGSEQTQRQSAKMDVYVDRMAGQAQQQLAVAAISLESLSGILTIPVNQARKDFGPGRLCYIYGRELKPTNRPGCALVIRIQPIAKTAHFLRT